MSFKEKDLFIFDLDGTLVDAYKAIEQSLNFTRKKFGLTPIDYNTAKRNVGKGDKPFVDMFFPKELRDKAVDVYREHHKQAIKRFAQPKEYAKMLLYRLKQKGKLLAIASNRPAFYTDIILKNLDMKKYFDCVLCADDVNSWKPKPKILQEVLTRLKVPKEKAVYTGDMDVDLETAKRAKMEAIFIAGGSSPLSDVKQYKNKIVVHSLKELYGLVNGKVKRWD
ncbi:MAG: HAD family hydrolase [Candidatus Omnitrophota bacterium]